MNRTANIAGRVKSKPGSVVGSDALSPASLTGATIPWQTTHSSPSVGIQPKQQGLLHQPPLVVRPQRAVEGAKSMKQTANTIKSFFIRNLLESSVVQSLIEQGEKAHALNDTPTLLRVGASLCERSLRGDLYETGLYYTGLALKRANATDRARRVFERLSEAEGKLNQARAAVALGTIEVENGNLSSALHLFDYSIQASGEPTILYHANHNKAVIFGIDGDSERALTQLEAALNLSQYVARPFVLNTLQNIAVELNELGKVDEASRVIQTVTRSPFVSAYPEWTDTANEIAMKQAEKRLRASRITVSERWGAVEKMRQQCVGYLTTRPDPFVVVGMHAVMSEGR